MFLSCLLKEIESKEEQTAVFNFSIRDSDYKQGTNTELCNHRPDRTAMEERNQS